MTKTAKTKASAVCLPVPAGDRFLVRREKRAENKSPGGIVMPDNVKEEQTHGTITAVVLAAGPGRLVDDGTFRRSVDCDVGDRLVLDSVHTAWWIEDPADRRERVHFINAIDVLAVLR